MVKALRKKWGIILIIGVILMCVGIYICKMPREMKSISALNTRTSNGKMSTSLLQARTTKTG